ncbi:MAG TPA: N-acetyltransferase [Bryobacteraceae bacterium]|nr:N-acetyltransferase [Bryobacteraceae bacterium]
MRNAIAFDYPTSRTPEMIAGSELVLRKASMPDIRPLLELINGYAAKGIMLPRTEFEMSENIRDFTLAFSGDKLVGCGALHFYSPTSGEVRSLAVDPTIKNRGIGRAIVEALELEANEYQLHSIFAFTYAPGFFERVGFHEVERGALPLKAWKDCLRCPKFQQCDEIAVIKYLVPEELRHDPVVESVTTLDFIQLPVLRS